MHHFDEGVSAHLKTLLMLSFPPDHDAWRNKLAAWSTIAINLKILNTASNAPSSLLVLPAKDIKRQATPSWLDCSTSPVTNTHNVQSKQNHKAFAGNDNVILALSSHQTMPRIFYQCIPPIPCHHIGCLHCATQKYRLSTCIDEHKKGYAETCTDVVLQ